MYKFDGEIFLTTHLPLASLTVAGDAQLQAAAQPFIMTKTRHFAVLEVAKASNSPLIHRHMDVQLISCTSKLYLLKVSP